MTTIVLLITYILTAKIWYNAGYEQAMLKVENEKDVTPKDLRPRD